MKRIILAGGSGFLGRSLAAVLINHGYEVVVLSRRPGAAAPGATAAVWDGKTPGDWTRQLDAAHAVVNLAGKNVNCRYTRNNLDQINVSRIDSVNAIGRAIAACDRPPKVWVQASTLAIYGDAGDRVCDETTPVGRGIPVETAVAWEKAFDANPSPATRRVLLRISFALGQGGGALRTLVNLTRWFLGGTIGTGRQYVSWVHVEDLNQMFLTAIERDEIEGVYNATSPNPVPNAQFMRQLRRALGRPWSPPVPAWAVHIGSFVMRTEPVLALTGRRGEPKRLVEAGFQFQFPRLREALDDLLNVQT